MVDISHFQAPNGSIIQLPKRVDNMETKVDVGSLLPDTFYTVSFHAMLDNGQKSDAVHQQIIKTS